MSEDISVVEALRAMKFDADPDEAFKARLRTRLVAVASIDAQPARPVHSRPLATFVSGIRRVVASSRTIAAMTTLSILLAASGLLVIAGKSSLPGDALYGVKQASEQIQLALASSPTDAAYTRLGFAQERLVEINKLLGSPTAMSPGTGPTAGAGDSAKVGKLINQTLESMDSDVKAGVNELATAATKAGNKTPLDTLKAWSGQQKSVLSKLTPRLPTSSVARAAESSKLLSQVDIRVGELLLDLNDSCLNATPDDELGPKPCVGTTLPQTTTSPTMTTTVPKPAPVDPPASATAGAPAAGGGAAPGDGGAAPGGAPQGGGAAPGGAVPSPAPAQPALPKPPATAAPPPAQVPDPAPQTTTAPPPGEGCLIYLLGICIG